MSTWFWIKAIMTFLLVATIGLAWAYWKHESGQKGARIDEFLRWLLLADYAWRVIGLIIFASAMFWMAAGHLKGH
jgi:hypothetical protein